MTVVFTAVNTAPHRTDEEQDVTELRTNPYDALPKAARQLMYDLDELDIAAMFVELQAERDRLRERIHELEAELANRTRAAEAELEQLRAERSQR